MNRINSQIAGIACLFVIVAMNLPAQTFTYLAGFNEAAGCAPVNMSLVQGTDGNLYGTAIDGGDTNGCDFFGCGTVFKITPEGTLTGVYSFSPSGNTGINPFVGLDLATSGNFYGATTYGGLNNLGAIFVVTPGGAETTLYESSPISGTANPLVQGADGNFYGTGGCDIYGTNCGLYNHGTVFQITPKGVLTILYNFSGTDGSGPSRLTQGADGYFYGTTGGGGANGSGTVFSITADGTLTTLYSFNGPDGSSPVGGVIQALDRSYPNGALYGTTSSGGAYGFGTAFRLAFGGTLTTLHNFDGTDGSYPEAPLVQGTDGNFYGTTDVGGAYGNYGTAFEVTPEGAFTSLHSFDVGDGAYLYGSGLVQATNGDFYGVTGIAGTDSCAGSIFSISMGLGPFVKPLPKSGQIGAPVKILGTNLTGTTGVTFNGAAASFTVVSATEISTTVPPGATTGRVTVTAPSGTLLSGGLFQVRP